MYSLKTVVPIIIISLLAGMFAFTASRYKPSTLVIQTRTLEKGSRTISAEEFQSNGIFKTRFEIGNDEGDPSYYTIELPRIRLKSVTIPPLAGVGKYEINRIIFSNDGSSYSWNEELACSRKYYQQKILTREICSSSDPVISINNDSSLSITSLPEAGTENSFRFRLAIAVASFLGALITCLLLFSQIKIPLTKDSLLPFVVRSAWLTIILLYLYQLYMLGTYSVDIPFWEEWEFFDEQALMRGFSLQWLLHPVSHSSMMVFTKFMAWLNLKLFSLDFVKLKIANYILFGGLLMATAQLKNRIIGNKKFRLFPLFIIFLISPIAYEVHSASFQSGETCVVLFSVLMLYYAISKETSLKTTLAFSLLAILAIASIHAGIIYTLVYLVCRTVYLSAGIRTGRLSFNAGLRSILLSWLIVVPLIFFWFYRFKKPEYNPPWLLPFDMKYWDSYLNLIGFGFGVDADVPIAGLIGLLLVLTPLVILVINNNTRWQPATWQCITAIIGTLAVTAVIVMGRGNTAGSIKLSRYVIFCFMLIPYASIAWWLALETRPGRNFILAALWSVCAICYYNNWDFKVYRDTRHQDILYLECVEQYNEGAGNGICQGTHFRSIGGYFDNAKKLDANFTRQFRKTLNKN